jgi:hypothetical protein
MVGPEEHGNLFGRERTTGNGKTGKHPAPKRLLQMFIEILSRSPFQSHSPFKRRQWQLAALHQGMAGIYVDWDRWMWPTGNHNVASGRADHGKLRSDARLSVLQRPIFVKAINDKDQPSASVRNSMSSAAPQIGKGGRVIAGRFCPLEDCCELLTYRKPIIGQPGTAVTAGDKEGHYFDALGWLDREMRHKRRLSRPWPANDHQVAGIASHELGNGLQLCITTAKVCGARFNLSNEWQIRRLCRLSCRGCEIRVVASLRHP